MTTQTTKSAPSASRRIAAEIRAELGRQSMSGRRLAVSMGVSYAWLNRRIGSDATVDLTFEDVDRIASVLKVPTGRIIAASGWLPRLDSNQQPFGYRRTPRIPAQRTAA